MAGTSGYKEYARLERVMTVEDLFNKGMSYVNTPLDEGNAKLLVNYDLKNQGTSLTPRGGLVEDDGAYLPEWYVPDPIVIPTLHHVGSSVMHVEYDLNGNDNFIFKYFLLARTVKHPITKKVVYDLDNFVAYIKCIDARYSTEYDWSFYCSWMDGGYTKNNYLAASEPVQSVLHDELLEDNLYCAQGVYASVEANTYLPVYDTVTKKNKLVRMQFDYQKYNQSVPNIKVKFVEVQPKEISASQVINTGYNMLKTDPYAFTNTQNATGALELKGITIRDADGNIKFTADVGEAVTFSVHYTYPASHKDPNAKMYGVEWAIKDTTTSEAPTVLTPIGQGEFGESVIAGNDMTYTTVIPYKHFTIIVKVYDYQELIDASNEASSSGKPYEKPAPLKVVTVSSYSSNSDDLGNTANMSPKKFELPSCTGMCTWQQRLVLWGVNGAKSTLFVSQPNLPEYMPFPNNVEVFTEDIVRCVTYLGNLLVFTTSRLYMLTMNATGTGTTYITKCVQERLIMSEEDAATVQVVKNMVYFKSGNYFYMMVPNSRVGAGELQLAPISTPVESLLDNFNESVLELFNTVYSADTLFDRDSYYDLKLLDYSNYLDGTTMRNVYKYKVEVYSTTGIIDSRYMDFCLNYDTALRSWTTYVYESSRFRMAPFEYTITGSTLLLRMSPFSNDHTLLNFPSLVKFEAGNPEDTIDGTSFDKRSTSKFVNHQLIDTGYRNHFSPYKKRFREIQFTINNVSQEELNFYTSFTVDDDVRKALFSYNVVHVTDPASPDYGMIYVERELTENTNTAGSIKLDSGKGMTLDFSKFDELTLAKVRYNVSGKGYVGRIQILSKNQVPYELLGTHWVYRKMNAR